jgi:hypothetical protein
MHRFIREAIALCTAWQLDLGTQSFEGKHRVKDRSAHNAVGVIVAEDCHALITANCIG